MFDPKRSLLYFGRILLATVAFLGLLLGLAIPAELYKERIPLADLTQPFAAPGVYWGLLRDMLPGIVAAGAAFFLASNFIVALYRLRNWREGAEHIWRCIFGQPSFAPFVVVSGGNVKATDDHMLMRVGGPGSIVTHSDSAAVLQQGGRLTRVMGPGKIGSGSLTRFEKVRDAVDVRPMRWEYQVRALSKEGIPVTLSVDVVFQVNTDGREATENTPYPVSDIAVFKASVCRAVRHPEADEEDQYFDWARRVIIGETEGTLRNILARYQLNQLVGLEGTSRPGADHPRRVIQEELETALKKSAAELGAQINKVWLGTIRVGDKVTEQWIEAWQNRWRDWALVEETAGEAARETLREAAKAQAQVDMITAMTQAFQYSVSRDDSIPQQLLIMRLIEVFDHFALDPHTRIYLPAEAIETLDRLRGLIG